VLFVLKTFREHQMKQLLIATNNKGKIKELQELLKETGIELFTPAQINLDLDVVEDGSTYVENASKKAIAFAHASGLISLADDSGLEVNALDGAPGLYSARYGSPDGHTVKLSDAERRAFLIRNLQNKARPWTARFHATIAIAVPDGETYLAIGVGENHGRTLHGRKKPPQPSGTGGDEWKSDLKKAISEIERAENKLPHRSTDLFYSCRIRFKVDTSGGRSSLRVCQMICKLTPWYS
jgi:XTP/dITP diphosphohydrolase